MLTLRRTVLKTLTFIRKFYLIFNIPQITQTSPGKRRAESREERILTVISRSEAFPGGHRVTQTGNGRFVYTSESRRHPLISLASH